MCVLAALCLDDLREMDSLRVLRRLLPGCALVAVMFVIGLISTPQGRTFARVHLGGFYWLNFLQVGGAICLIVLTPLIGATSRLAARDPQRRRAPFSISTPHVLGLLLCAEASVFFMVTIVEWPTSSNMELSPVTFLQKNLGSQRFFSLHDITPNYGTLYGIQSLDATDLPIPRNWANYVHAKLSPSVSPWLFGNGGTLSLTRRSATVDLIANLSNYEDAGVRYVVIPRTVDLPSLYQPSPDSAATSTPDGGTTLDLSYSAGSFVSGATIRAVSIKMPGAPPRGLTATVCSATCVPSTLLARNRDGETFALSHPLALGPVLKIRLTASDSWVQVTVSSVPGRNAPVTAAGRVLPGRVVLVRLTYDPSTLPKLVLSDPLSSVLRLPRASSIASAAGCLVHVNSLTSFTATCATGSRLIYRELSFPGWHATVNGATSRITTFDSVFQEVSVPKGTSTITFAYEPPGSLWAWVAMALGVAAIASGGGWRHRRRLHEALRRFTRQVPTHVSAHEHRLV